MQSKITKNIQYYKFCLYGFLKNLRFFEPFLLLFFLDKGINYFEIGLLYAAREVGRNIFEIPAGVIADILGRKRTMAFSFIAYIGSFLLFSFFLSFGWMMLAMIVFSLGDAFRTGTHKAMIFSYLKKNNQSNLKIHYYGHTRSWSQLGSAISTLIAATLVFFTGGYRYIFLFSVLPYVLDLLNVLSYPAYLDGTNRKNISLKDIQKGFRMVFKDFMVGLKRKEIRKLLMNTSIHSGTYRVAKDYLQPILAAMAVSIPLFTNYAKEQKSAILVGFIYFFIYIATSSVSKRSGIFGEKFSTKNTALNYTMIFSSVLLLMSGLCYYLEYEILAVLLFISIFLIENLRNPIGVSAISEAYNEKIMATALSSNSQLKSIFGAIAAIVLGSIAAYTGIGMAIALVSLILLLSTPLVWLNQKQKEIQ